MKKLYKNIGYKIKCLAFGCFIAEAIAFLLLGISCFAIAADGYDELSLVGLILILVGPITAFLGSWCVYGFGQLIENTSKVDIYDDEDLIYVYKGKSSNTKK